MKIKYLLILILFLLSSCSVTTKDDKPTEPPLQPNQPINEEIKMIYIHVNDVVLTCNLIDNSTSASFVEKLKENDITINMHDYGNFEKVGPLPFSLPRNDTFITTTPGDVIVYLGNQITIYYDTNSYSFTKIGHIDDYDKRSLLSILGSDDVTVTFSLNK